MGTLAPAVADAFDLLHNNLCGHLDNAESLALSCKEWTEEDAETARKLIPDLVTVIRGLLYDHRMRPDGDCRTCTSVWPCPVVTLIHSLLKDPEREYVALVNRVHDAEQPPPQVTCSSCAGLDLSASRAPSSPVPARTGIVSTVGIPGSRAVRDR